MRSTATGKWAGKVDMVVAHDGNGQLKWCGLEIQAVYFSGPGMRSEFARLRASNENLPFPDAVRRPDWRSSGAKRLMPQLQIKVPTLRRWGSKMAVAVDAPFFDAIGGPSETPTQDLNDGDIIWLVPELQENAQGELTLVRGHWEVLTLEESEKRLLAAETVLGRVRNWTALALTADVTDAHGPRLPLVRRSIHTTSDIFDNGVGASLGRTEFRTKGSPCVATCDRPSSRQDGCPQALARPAIRCSNDRLGC